VRKKENNESPQQELLGFESLGITGDADKSSFLGAVRMKAGLE
jgi:hypothetical protein